MTRHYTEQEIDLAEIALLDRARQAAREANEHRLRFNQSPLPTEQYLSRQPDWHFHNIVKQLRTAIEAAKALAPKPKRKYVRRENPDGSVDVNTESNNQED